MSRKPDAYDQAVQWLRRRPTKIARSWNLETPARILFGYVNKSRGSTYRGKLCGCLTQVKSNQYEAQTKRLTNAIRVDPDVPSDPFDIRPRHLPVFAKWQRKIDKILKRKPPVWVKP